MSDGTVKHADRFSQPIHFKGVRFGQITPTDIDAVLEFRDKLFVLIEVKTAGTEMEPGQLMAYERMCKAIDTQPGKTCVVFKCWHKTPYPNPVILRDLAVQSVFWNFGGNYKWLDNKEHKWLPDSVNNLLSIVGLPEDVIPRCVVERAEELDWDQCPF